MNLFDRIEKIKSEKSTTTEVNYAEVTEVTEVTKLAIARNNDINAVTSSLYGKATEGTKERKQAAASPVAFWLELADSGKPDRAVETLDEALFLFACHKIRETDLKEIKLQYLPYWRKRMVSSAWQAFRLILDQNSR